MLFSHDFEWNVQPGLCWCKSKLWTNTSSWKQETCWVYLGILKDCICLHWGELLKPGVLRMNHKSSSLYLSHQDGPGYHTPTASTLPPELRERISTRCFAFLKQVLVQYKMRLPASLEMPCKLELFCLKPVMSTINRPGLPTEFSP